MNYLYIVATNKDVLVTIRIAPEIRDQFKTAAELRGSTMSGLMHQFIVRTIREEREAMPHAFRTQAIKAADKRLTTQRETNRPIEMPRKRKTG